VMLHKSVWVMVEWFVTEMWTQLDLVLPFGLD